MLIVNGPFFVTLRYNMENLASLEWEKCTTDVFWGEIAPCNHLVQIYDNDEVVMDMIEGFVVSGFNSEEAVIIIATQNHLDALDARLTEQGFDINALRASNQYISLNAEIALTKFMVYGWPDEAMFMKFVNDTVVRAKGFNDRKVRAYGEMVAILWEQGYSGATVQLEHLWNKFCETENFCLFCASPKSGFTQDLNTSLNHICSTHSKIIAGNISSRSEVFYKQA